MILNSTIKNAIIILVLMCTQFCLGQMSRGAKREKTIQDIGDIAQFAPAAAALSTIFIFKDKKGAWQFTKAFATNLAATYILKYTIDKPRPEGATDGQSFPSGHTAVAFQGASFMQRRYGWQYGIPAYAVAGFVAYTRLEGYNDRHDAWDVLGGIIVGVGSTYIFTTPYQQEHLELTFNSGNNTYMLGLKYKF